ncbi:hypothetical protein EV121DRAFT_273126, partial [Schizophyllum commune]
MSPFLRGFTSSLTRGTYTVYLFTKTDIVPFLCPALAMGMVLAGPPDALALVEGIVWTELHLLAFQLLGLQEDRLSKPHRPLPAGRITPEATRILHFAFVAASWPRAIASRPQRTHYDWRRVRDYGQRSSLVRKVHDATAPFFLQGYAQDFRDRAGDAAVGRKTIPLILSHGLAQWLLGVSLFGWTAALVYFWEPPAAFSLLLGGLALTSAMLFVRGCTEAADARAYWWYS